MKLLREQEHALRQEEATSKVLRSELSTLTERSTSLCNAAEDELQAQERLVGKLKHQVEAEKVARSAMVEESRGLIAQLQSDLGNANNAVMEGAGSSGREELVLLPPLRAELAAAQAQLEASQASALQVSEAAQASRSAQTLCPYIVIHDH